ncbi:MAG: hypothetical protein ACRC0F_06495 [Cetobacterium sp.]
MKKINIILLLLFSSYIYGEELNEEYVIEQPPLQELSVLTIQDEIKSNEIILSMNGEIINLKLDLVVAQKRMDLMDKVIEDKNKLTDELENEVEILQIKMKEYQEREKANKNGFEKDIVKKIYQIGAIIALMIIFLFIVCISLLILKASKNRKILEDWKDILELKSEKLDLIEKKYPKYTGTKSEEIKDDFEFIIKG